MKVKITLINDNFNSEKLVQSSQLGDLPSDKAEDIYNDTVKFFREKCKKVQTNWEPETDAK